MKVRRLQWRNLALSVLVIAAVAGATLGITTLFGVTFQGAGTAQTGSGSEPVGNLLLTANRDRLALCVDAPSGSQQLASLARVQVEEAYAEVAADPYWEKANLADAVAEPSVDIGCPSEPFLLQPGVISESSRSVVAIPEVSAASYYRVFVFVLPPEEIERLPVNSAGLATEESLREGRTFDEVTVGLYLTASEVQDTPLLIHALKKAIGLERPY